MTTISERPILFSGEMVRAILVGRKTQTRRVVKVPIIDRNGFGCELGASELSERDMQYCPYGQPGDRLWVKETFGIPYKLVKGRIAPREDIVYRANPRDESSPLKWKPSIFMRREYCRLVLEIVRVRVERVQDITEADAKAEGVQASTTVEMKDGSPCYTLPYQKLWTQINGCDSWYKNPWVWVIEFQRIGQSLSHRGENAASKTHQ